MGMDLVRLADSEKFICNNFFWGRLIDVALSNGWNPKGTYKLDDNDDEDPNWSGSYLDNDGQIVDSDDALNLLIALERSMEENNLSEQDWIDAEISLLKDFIKWGRLTNSDLGYDNEPPGFEIW